MIKKILIANRGEIAVRIIRTCKEMNIDTVAIYSTADKESLHVQLAHEAVCVGSHKSIDSYLNENSIIEAALCTQCDAIHPGFGFLSENSGFAKKIIEAGLIFIGPSPEIIDLMGDKNNARNMMKKANVRIIPGSEEIYHDVKKAKKFADSIGYPVMIKASSGGGGRGIRLCYQESEFENAFLSAKQESKVCFKNEDIYIEKFISSPKHIEVQILGDKFNNVVHLYERDCSFQRRNQKMIEEAPCFTLDKSLRNKICQEAIKASKYVGYDSVGTIEFLLDDKNEFYFLEMNTRIQVEHPITEMITGIDIIKHQIRVSDNQPLNIKQEDIKCEGYAIECRINAENPKDNFAPSSGKIKFLNLPTGNGIRIETAVYNGYEIPPFYDSMILKIIAYAPTRLACIKRMRIALEELIIDGINNNVEFHYLALHHKKFIEGKYNTSFADEFIEEIKNNGAFI